MHASSAHRSRSASAFGSSGDWAKFPGRPHWPLALSSSISNSCLASASRVARWTAARSSRSRDSKSTLSVESSRSMAASTKRCRSRCFHLSSVMPLTSQNDKMVLDDAPLAAKMPSPCSVMLPVDADRGSNMESFNSQANSRQLNLLRGSFVSCGQVCETRIKSYNSASMSSSSCLARVSGNAPRWTKAFHFFLSSGSMSSHISK
mmetsp:Transcript_56814/g.158202  ORF Transcript_56814/g.158202 Transcript_56814/m.158202 type:complete len:205 (+) Transcript_56814:153-767(+)